MACFKQWSYTVGAYTATLAGVAGMLGSGIVEAGSLGAATPAVCATFVGSALATIAGLAAYIGTLEDLAECYAQAGQAEDAERVRQRSAALAEERDRLQALVDRVRATAGV